MKAIRGLCLIGLYILGLPVLVPFVLGLLIYTCFKQRRECGEISIQDIKDLINAAIDGLVTGHKINMIWVRYGLKLQDFPEEEL